MQPIPIDALVPPPGASGLGLQLFWRVTNDNPFWSSDAFPSFPHTIACLGKELTQPNKQMSWTDKINLSCAHAAVSQPGVGQSLGHRVLKDWTQKTWVEKAFQFLFCNSISKSELLFITSA